MILTLILTTLQEQSGKYINLFGDSVTTPVYSLPEIADARQLPHSFFYVRYLIEFSYFIKLNTFTSPHGFKLKEEYYPDQCSVAS